MRFWGTASGPACRCMRQGCPHYRGVPGPGLGPFVFCSQKLAVSARGWQNPSATQGRHICRQASVVLKGHSGTGFEGSKVCQNHWSCCRDLQGWGEGISSSRQRHWFKSVQHSRSLGDVCVQGCLGIAGYIMGYILWPGKEVWGP